MSLNIARQPLCRWPVSYINYLKQMTFLSQTHSRKKNPRGGPGFKGGLPPTENRNYEKCLDAAYEGGRIYNICREYLRFTKLP